MQKRSIEIIGDTALVPLTKGFTAIIDANDVGKVDSWNWTAVVKPHTVYAQRTVKAEDGKRASVKMHRVLLNAPDGCEVDHADGNGLNNKKSNIRIADAFGNRQNRAVPKSNTSGLKGAFFHKRDNKWMSKIVANGRSIFLGYFPDKESAHAAYQEGSKKYHGEFSRAI